jgi:hypothetical protein
LAIYLVISKGYEFTKKEVPSRRPRCARLTDADEKLTELLRGTVVTMASDLFAAVWSVPYNPNAAVQTKLSDLGDAAAEAFSSMNTAAARMKVIKPIFVFAAPEYYFIPSIDPTSLHDSKEMIQIYCGLRDISKELKDLIMIPGTVNWQVPLSEVLLNQLGYIKNMPLAGTDKIARRSYTS